MLPVRFHTAGVAALLFIFLPKSVSAEEPSRFEALRDELTFEGRISFPDAVAPVVSDYLNCRVLQAGSTVLAGNEEVTSGPGEVSCVALRASTGENLLSVFESNGVSSTLERELLLQRTMGIVDALAESQRIYNDMLRGGSLPSEGEELHAAQPRETGNAQL